MQSPTSAGQGVVRAVRLRLPGHDRGRRGPSSVSGRCHRLLSSLDAPDVQRTRVPGRRARRPGAAPSPPRRTTCPAPSRAAWERGRCPQPACRGPRGGPRSRPHHSRGQARCRPASRRVLRPPGRGRRLSPVEPRGLATGVRRAPLGLGLRVLVPGNATGVRHFGSVLVHGHSRPVSWPGGRLRGLLVHGAVGASSVALRAVRRSHAGPASPVTLPAQVGGAFCVRASAEREGGPLLRTLWVQSSALRHEVRVLNARSGVHSARPGTGAAGPAPPPGAAAPRERESLCRVGELGSQYAVVRAGTYGLCPGGEPAWKAQNHSRPRGRGSSVRAPMEPCAPFVSVAR